MWCIQEESMKRSAALVALISVMLMSLAVASPAVAQEALDENTIWVSASGQVEMEPDQATVTFGVRVLEDTAAEANDRLAERANGVIRTLERFGIDPDDIDTYGVSLFRKYRYVNKERVFVGYAGSMGIRAKTTNLDRVGALIRAGIEGGADTLRGVGFGVEDRRAAVLLALEEAMTFARAKAERLAALAGRQLGQAIQIIESGSRPPRTVQVEAVYGAALPGASADQAIVVRPDEITARATVDVVYQMI